MKTFSTETTINAAPETVWMLLTDGAKFAAWNSTVERVEGSIAPGETIKVFAKISSGRAFPVKVSGFDPPRRMVWSSGMPLGLFKGERTFTLSPIADGGTRFAMREAFTGLMAPLIGRSIPDLQPEFEKFAADLKAAAEAPTPG